MLKGQGRWHQTTETRRQQERVDLNFNIFPLGDSSVLAFFNNLWGLGTDEE
jgi:hypothetical protein